MRLRRRHAWGAVLIALFVLPVLKPAGIAAVEGPTGSAFAWVADVLPSTRSVPASSDGPCDDARVRALQQQNRELYAQLMRARQTVGDLGALKKALERSELDRMPKAVRAEVLRAHDPVPSRRSILINRGRADGLRIGHAAVMGGVYVGRVRVVHEHSALVQLLTDPSSRLEVLVRTSKDQMLRGYALRRGSKDGVDLLEVRFVRLRGDVGIIRPGAPVYTSNFDERVPAHLEVGTVDEVSDPDRDGMPSLFVTPSLDLDRSTEVVILVPSSRRRARSP